MAPPGFAPPSYSHDRIPTRFVTKEAPPPGADTNTRAYLIFFSFLSLAISLTTFVILQLRTLYSRLPSRAETRLTHPNLHKHIRVYALLAICSVVTVWYYEVQYFKVSYLTWVRWRSYYDLEEHQMHWGLWLKETSLFKEGWEIAVVGNARYWWTHQIFFFACGLGLSLEQKGIRRGIKHAWAFMLLGQVVSVAFATNLYLLSLLLSAPSTMTTTPSKKTVEVHQKKWLGPWLFSLLMIVFTEGPAYMLADEHYWYHETDFLPMIITPHVALLFLPIARALLPSTLFTDSSVEFAGTVYGYLWGATIFGGGLLLARMTAISYNYSGFRGIWDALLEAPAVSSIAFDVIFCWIAWGVWWSIQGRRPSDPLKDKEEDGEVNDGSIVGSSQYEPVRDNEGVRRR
ncbi:hypothetical protein DM02DRAFT_691659 [Periconia macrospinosa]|uniref:Uncharacterized protein n=1 Tax=Periconia macrospinosa TaxID=97972 RepID=A0A2V1DD74_9PLEO|nr:hypothetical protein DM02DRAFT_691659 [Periconia macrospinosa]